MVDISKSTTSRLLKNQYERAGYFGVRRLVAALVWLCSRNPWYLASPDASVKSDDKSPHSKSCDFLFRKEFFSSLLGLKCGMAECLGREFEKFESERSIFRVSRRDQPAL